MQQEEIELYIAIEKLFAVHPHDYAHEIEYFATMEKYWELVKARDPDAADTTFKAVLYMKLAPGVGQQWAAGRDCLDYINEVLERCETASHQHRRKSHGIEHPYNSPHGAEDSQSECGTWCDRDPWQSFRVCEESMSERSLCNEDKEELETEAIPIRPQKNGTWLNITDTGRKWQHSAASHRVPGQLSYGWHMTSASTKPSQDAASQATIESCNWDGGQGSDGVSSLCTNSVHDKVLEF
jgi:hypothetical protein